MKSATLEEALQEAIDNEAVNELVRYHTNLQAMINSGFLTPAIKDGEVNPALPEEDQRMIRASIDKAVQQIVDDIDRDILEQLSKL